MGGRPRRALRGRAVLVAAVAAALVTVVVSPAPAGAGVLTVSPTGTFIVKMRGNGHGHGMSQYGARGAAIVGKSYQQILAFYYAGTTLTTLPPRTLIRVRLSGVGTTTTVAPYSDLVLTGVAGKLPATGVKRYRLVADATTGLTLQQLKSATGAKWTVFKTGLPNRAEFHRTGYGAARVYATDATSSDYYGFLRAVRAKATGTSGGVSTVDVVTLDRYTAGVIPQEMPTSWQRPAVDAQAVAARTYGRYAVEHPQGVEYDICDTTQCQVYGGHANYDASGVRLSTDFQPPPTLRTKCSPTTGRRSSPSSARRTAAGRSTAGSPT
jgi:hypothetical protein